MLVIVAAILLSAVEIWAHPPWGIAVDERGQIFFSDLENIWKVDAQGKLMLFRTGVRGKHTHELTIDENGNICGEDLAYEPATERYQSALWKITLSGDFQYILAPTYNPPKGMSIWKDSAGNSVLKITPDGKAITLIRSEASWSPSGVALRNGDLYILEFESKPSSSASNVRVRQFSSDGKIRTVAVLGENENPASSAALTGENSGENIRPNTVSRRNTLYLILGAAISAFVLTLVVWRRRKKATG